ncbi:MAG: hypothetical protein RhofKO_28860 [Rhodothermales bacterium]
MNAIPLSRELGVLILVGLVLAGCSSTELNPFENEDRYFTIWGYLDAEAETQYIRIAPVRRSPEQIDSPDDAQATLDAKVYMIEVDTGREFQWQKSLQRTDDGSGRYVHVFESHFRPFQGSTYRLEVTRSDGVRATTEVTVPDVRSEDFPVEYGEVYEGEDGQLYQDMLIRGIRSPGRMMMVYYASIGTRENNEDIAIGVPYELVEGEMDADGWRFTAHLTEDVPEIEAEAIYLTEAVLKLTNTVFGVRLYAVGVYLQMPDADWVLPSDLDTPEVLAQPHFSNITNGYGYLGATGAYRYQWGVTEQLGWDMGLPRGGPEG